MSLPTDACGEECAALLKLPNGEKRHLFAVEYAGDCDLERAYDAAGYTGKRRQSMHDVLTNPDVQGAVRRHRAPVLQETVDRATRFRGMLWDSLRANVFELYTAQEPTSRARRHLETVIKKGVEDRSYTPPAPSEPAFTQTIHAAIELLRLEQDVAGALDVLEGIGLGSKGWRPSSEKELQRAIDRAAMFRAKRPDEIPPELQVLVDRVKIDASRGKIEYWIDRSANKKLWAQVSGLIQQTITLEQAAAVGEEPVARMRAVLPELLSAVEEDRAYLVAAAGELRAALGGGGNVAVAARALLSAVDDAGAVVRWVRGVAQEGLDSAEERGDSAWVERWSRVLSGEVGSREMLMGVVFRVG